MKRDGDVADLANLDSFVANGAVRFGGSDDVEMAANGLQNSREGVDAVLSEGVVASDLSKPHLEVVVVTGV